MGEGQESCARMVTVCSAVQEETVSLGSTSRTRRYTAQNVVYTECCLQDGVSVGQSGSLVGSQSPYVSGTLASVWWQTLT